VPLAASIEQLYPPQAVPSSFTSGNLLDTQPVSHSCSTSPIPFQKKMFLFIFLVYFDKLILKIIFKN
jgi:hypothetical protein